MSEHEPIPRPHFVMMGGNSDELPIKSFEHAIFESPQKYLDIVSEIGQTTGSDTFELEDGREAPIDGDSLTRVNQLFKFFKEGFDKEVFFDDPTENALRENQQHSELVDKLMNSRSRIRKVGGFQTKEENEEAPKLRDQVRLSRIGFFIRRVIEWQQTEASEDTADSDLRSIG